MIGDEFELYALAREAHKQGIPEAAAAVFRRLLQRHPQSPLAAHAMFYLHNGYQFPSANRAQARQPPELTPSELNATLELEGALVTRTKT